MSIENQGGENEVVPSANEVLPVVEETKAVPEELKTNRFSFSSLKMSLVSKKYLLAIPIFLVLIIVGAFIYQNQDQHVAIKQFTNVFSFVPEKISKSAAITINLPDGVDEETAKRSITFSPEVEGSWQTEEVEKVVIFQPKKPLKSKVYYAVNMDTGLVQMSGDFYVDEDPKVLSVFPIAGSESHEDSEITIVFNRPMVPLTTLTEQEEVALPITIDPPTPGKFKWISTRNLQFIPETTLVPSSDYTVKIAEGLISVDGLPVAPITHTFITRPLRYEYLSDSQISYRAPIVVRFNQDVDLEKTAKQVSVKNEDGDEVGIEVVYGENSYYDYESGKEVFEKVQDTLFIYQKNDKHGRNRLWDFETTYNLSVAGAVPLFGTKDLTEGRNSVVNVPDVVAGVDATSERSSLVRPDLFDPEGRLVVSFYDEIDKDRSDFTVKGLRGIEYLERCKTDEFGEAIRMGDGCEKEADKTTLVFQFNPGAFSLNEEFNLELKKLQTPDGFKVNAEPMNLPLRTYPALEFKGSFPKNGSETASPGDGLFVCTNTPLKEPKDGYVDEYIKGEGYVIYGKMEASQYVYRSYDDNRCREGEYVTWFSLGLLPETAYSFTLSPVDAFGQTVSAKLDLKTTPPEAKYTRFHNLQEAYNVTPPERTKLTYAVENLEYVDMHICQLEPEKFLGSVTDQAEYSTPPSGVGCTKVITEKILLPVRYWVTNHFQINLADYFPDTRGHYIITFSNPLYKENYSDKQIYDRTYVSVTNLAVGKKEVEHSVNYRGVYTDNPNANLVLDSELDKATNLYWVSHNKSLAAVVGAKVTQYESTYGKSFNEKSSAYTNHEGVARVSTEPDLVGVVIRSGQDTAVVANWSDTLNYASRAHNDSRTYVYTDRPIYRPGHTVNIRGIDRIGFDGKYQVWSESEAKLEIFDSQGNKVYEVSLPQNEYGTFNTSFELPSDAPLGTYQIVVFGQSSRFDVEEYVPAAFKLEAETNKEEYINGETMKIDVQADYYFGVPLDSGTVSYAVTAQDYYFDRYEDEYFNFGQSWYYCYHCSYGDDFLFRGEAKINDKGRAVIEQDLKLEKYFTEEGEEGSKLVTVSLTAKDINGRSVSVQKSFIVHKGDFYLGAKTDQYYTGVNTPVTFRVKSVDLNGKPVGLSGIERTIYKVTWETFKRQEVDGGFYYRSERKLNKISSEKIKTDSKGDWTETLSLAEEGEYEIQVEKLDERGNKVKTKTEIYIYGTKAISVPPNNNYELDLEVEKSSLDVGEQASVLIKSPYAKSRALITVERGTVYDYWLVDVVGGLYLHKFPIKSEYAPNIFVSVLLLSGDPEVKYGETSYEIGYKEQELKVEVTANKAHYLPGEEVTLQVETKDHSGKAVPAEVSLAVADLSVLALKGNPKKNPAIFFYSGFPLSVSTASNIKQILHEVDIPLGTKGGDGADPDDLAKKKRGLFKDTAYWSASVVTDANGRATVSFTLPDNLTTWQIEGLGVTKDTKLGVDYSEFTTKKDLMAVPLKPRFVVPGDTFSLGAKVFNQTTENTTVKVKLESNTLTFTGEQEKEVFINKGEAKTVYFTVKAPNEIKAGKHTFTFSASNQTFLDSVEQEIAITPNKTYETVATANFTKDDLATEYLYLPKEVVSGEGGLTINANATMAVFMTEAVNYMVSYPYGCSEQLASTLSTIGILTEALSLPNVEGELDKITHQGVEYTTAEVVKSGLARIYETQNFSGGFAYYKGLNENLYLTMHVVGALTELKEAGFAVDEEVMKRALTYIETETKGIYNKDPEYNRETVILAEYVLRKANGGKETQLSKIIGTLIKDQAFLNEKISSMSLAYLSVLTAEGFGRSSKSAVYEALQNRIEIDGRGAFLAAKGTANYNYFETPIKNTALLLKVFAAQQDEHTTMGNVLRWLLASRDQAGVWGGTHNTFSVIDAMVDYLKWQHETESHFSLRGLLSGVEIFGYEFNPSNVFKTFTHFVPVDELPREKLVPLTLEKKEMSERENNLYYDMALKYFLPVESLPPRDEGITITRELYTLDDDRETKPITSAKVGEVIKGKLRITVPEPYNHLSVEDMIPAGFELVNFNLATEDQSLKEHLDNSVENEYEEDWYYFFDNLFSETQKAQSFGSRKFGGSYNNQVNYLRPTHVETHDDRVFLYVDHLSEGVYEYEYFLRALVPGSFQHLPARAEELFFPEIFGRTEGSRFEVTPAE